MSIENRIEVNALQRSAMYLNRFGNLTCVRGEPFTELTSYKTEIKIYGAVINSRNASPILVVLLSCTPRGLINVRSPLLLNKPFVSSS